MSEVGGGGLLVGGDYMVGDDVSNNAGYETQKILKIMRSPCFHDKLG